MYFARGWLVLALSVGGVCCGGRAAEQGPTGNPSAGAPAAGAPTGGAGGNQARGGAGSLPPAEDAGSPVAGAPSVDGGTCVVQGCPAYDEWDAAACACVMIPGHCFVVSQCQGAVPDYCLDCADGSVGCAHYICGTSGMCEIADCGDVPPFTLGQECGPAAKYPTCPMMIPCVFDDGGTVGHCKP